MMTPGEAQLLTLAAAQFVVALSGLFVGITAMISSLKNHGRIKAVETKTDGMTERLEKAAHAAGVQAERDNPHEKQPNHER